MSSFKTFLRKIKYNLKYLFTSDIQIPSDFKIFTRKNTTYQNAKLQKWQSAERSKMSKRAELSPPILQKEAIQGESTEYSVRGAAGGI